MQIPIIHPERVCHVGIVVPARLGHGAEPRGAPFPVP